MDFLILIIGLATLFFMLRRAVDRVDALERRIGVLQTELGSLRSGGAVVVDETSSVDTEQPLPDASPVDETFGESEGAEGPASADATSPEAGDAEVAGADSSGPEAATARTGGADVAMEPRGWSAVDLESLIGGRWSVILGGVTVALGALFLVRYSIETGLLGPSARIASGTFFATALLAGGEWLRRKDRREHLPPFMSADIPGVLTGAGAVAAFGTIFAAHAIYGFIGPAAAFVLLTATGLACLLLASIHGPKLAAVGLLGSFAAPALVDSDAPNLLALVLHTLIVTASVFATARIRNWNWLAVGAVVGSMLWTMTAIFAADLGEDILIAALVIGVAVIYAVGFGWRPGRHVDPPEDAPSDRVALVSLAVFSIVAAIAVSAVSTPVAATIAAIVGVIYIAAAYLCPPLARIAPWTGLTTLMLGLATQLDAVVDPGIFDDRPYLGLPVPPDIGGFIGAFVAGAAPVAVAALLAAWRAAPTAPRLAGQLAIAWSLIAVLGLTAVYLRISNFETSIGTGVAALALAALAVALTELFSRMRPGDMRAPAPAAFAVAAISLIALAMGVMLTKTWLPFGMALTSAGVAWVHRSRPFAVLPYLVVILGLLSASGIYFNAPFEGEVIGTTIFFNQLILIAGLPSLALLAASIWLERAGILRLGGLQNALGLALLALFVALELRHFITGGHITEGEVGLADMAVQSMAALGFAIGLQLVARKVEGGIYDAASRVAGIVGVFMLFVGLGVAFNPLFTGEPVGQGRIFNLLLPAYLVTGLMAGVVVLMSEGARPVWYRIGYGLTAGMLLFLYATLMTRHGFQGERISFWRSTSDEEFWTYSAVWLSIGGTLLAAGFFTRSLPLRIASAALILLTIAKVFVLDMSALSGALRAFSFIGLGLSLLVIGRFYQRLLARTGNRVGEPG